MALFEVSEHESAQESLQITQTSGAHSLHALKEEHRVSDADRHGNRASDGAQEAVRIWRADASQRESASQQAHPACAPLPL